MGTDRPTILLVEDEEMVRTLTREMLAAHFASILTAGSGSDAIEVLGTEGDRIDLLVTDLSLPDMHGGDLARRARALRPGLRVLYVSGSPVDQPGDAAFLGKPFSREQLISAVQTVMAT